MARIILICGKICSGKTRYAREIAREENAVVLNADEVTTLFADDLKERHDAVSRRVRDYLCRKACEIAGCGVNVILDWGFWTRAMRAEVNDVFRAQGLPTEWHYLDIPDALWEQCIRARNACPGPADYRVDEGLKQKCLALFEPPERSEIDVWHVCS